MKIYDRILPGVVNEYIARAGFISRETPAVDGFTEEEVSRVQGALLALVGPLSDKGIVHVSNYLTKTLFPNGDIKIFDKARSHAMETFSQGNFRDHFCGKFGVTPKI